MNDVLLPQPRPTTDTARRAAKVCVVTEEINGPWRNGGIGTAYTALAELLAGAGHAVTVLYLNDWCDRHTVDHWQRHYRRLGVELVALPEAPTALSGSPFLSGSYRAYRWLKAQPPFNLVHFHEWLGGGYYTLLARHEGLAFESTTFCVGVHSPTLWLKEANQEAIDDLDVLECDALERRCVELADVVWSPSAHMLRWMTERGWRLPADHFVRPYLLPSLGPAVPDREEGPVRELVFFGRLEVRKGLLLLCDALDRLAQGGAGAGLAVTFLGRPTDLGGESSADVVRRRAKAWPFRTRLLTDHDHPEALAYLRGPGRVALMPSLLDNSPLTVLECLQLGVPFLASAVGGIPEAIAEADHDHLFEPTAAALADRLAAALDEGVRPARPAVEQEANRSAWQRWHRVGPVEPRPAPPDRPRVSVCLVTHERPAFLLQAVESLRRQDYDNFEVILVDDGSRSPEARACLDALEPEFRGRGWKLLRQDNRYLGAARNAAALLATGDYLLFMDDDNLARPHQLSTFVRAALATGADVVSSLLDFFDAVGADGEPNLLGRWLCAGVPSLAVGLARNCFGDANSLVRRSAFDAVGGFTEDHGVTHEDWEFLVKVVLRGLKLVVVPEPLVCYRVTADSMTRTTPRQANYARHLRPYLEEVPEAYRDLLRLAQGQALRLAAAAPPAPPPPGVGPRPLRYDIVDALNSGLKRLGPLHAAGRRAIGALVRCGRWLTRRKA